MCSSRKYSYSRSLWRLAGNSTGWVSCHLNFGYLLSLTLEGCMSTPQQPPPPTSFPPSVYVRGRKWLKFRKRFVKYISETTLKRPYIYILVNINITVLPGACTFGTGSTSASAHVPWNKTMSIFLPYNVLFSHPMTMN